MWDLIVSVPDHCLSFYFSRRHSTLYQVISELHETASDTGVFSVSRR